MLTTPLTTEQLVDAVRAVADATPNPCEGSLGHLRDDFAWQAEEDLRVLLADDESPAFGMADLRADCIAALQRWGVDAGC